VICRSRNLLPSAVDNDDNADYTVSDVSLLGKNKICKIVFAAGQCRSENPLLSNHSSLFVKQIQNGTYRNAGGNHF
jgi:hypothetical protein